MADTKRAFICGYPIAHSRSPSIHGYWIEQYGLNASYERIQVEPDQLKTFLSSLKNGKFVGGNATIPHKEGVFAHISKKDEAATAIGAANTIWFENNDLVAGNTDAYGFTANLDDQIPNWRNAKRAMIFGAGGASRAIIYALIVAGYERIYLVNRTLERAQKLAKSFGSMVHPMTWDEAESTVDKAELIINSTSLGMEGQPSFPPILEHAHRDALVSDIVYVPLETPFLKLAKQQGLKTSDGLGMLLHQAVPGFEKWFGVKPVVDKGLRERILAEVSKDENS